MTMTQIVQPAGEAQLNGVMAIFMVIFILVSCGVFYRAWVFALEAKDGLKMAAALALSVVGAIGIFAGLAGLGMALT